MHSQKVGLVIAIACGVFFFYAFFQRTAPSVFVGEIQEEFKVSGSVAALLGSMYFISYSLVQIPLGILLDITGPAKMCAIGALLTIGSVLLFAYSGNFGVAMFARFCIGFAVAFPWLAGIKNATIYFPKNRALVTGFTLSTGMSGAILGQGPLAALIDAVGWRQAMALSTIPVALIAIPYIIVSMMEMTEGKKKKDDVEEEDEKQKAGGGNNNAPAKPSVCAGLKLVFLTDCKNTTFLFIYAMMATGPLLSYGGLWVVPHIVHTTGETKAVAAGFGSLMSLGSAFAGPLAGILSDKFPTKRKEVMLTAAGITATFSLLAMYLVGHAPLELVAAFLFMAGFAAIPAFMLCFFLAAELYPKSMVGLASAIVNTGGLVSGVLFQVLVGAILDGGWDGKSKGTDGGRIYNEATYHGAFVVYIVCFIIQITMGCLIDAKKKKKETTTTTKSNEVVDGKEVKMVTTTNNIMEEGQSNKKKRVKRDSLVVAKERKKKNAGKKKESAPAGVKVEIVE